MIFICEIHGPISSDNIRINSKYPHRKPICKKCQSEQSKEWYIKNQDSVKARTNKYFQDNKEAMILHRREYYQENKVKLAIQKKTYRQEKSEQIKFVKKKHADELRYKAILHYSSGSMKCALCDEVEYSFLCLDHINGGGTKHRKSEQQVKGKAVYQWVKKYNYPPIFRVLCYNCNFLVSLRPSKNIKLKRHRDKIKREVMTHYSTSSEIKCENCPVIDIRILTIDHINGGGHKHLKSIGLKGGTEFYKWLRNNDYPQGYRVLCMNHNCAKK